MSDRPQPLPATPHAQNVSRILATERFNFYERLTNQGQFLLVAKAGIDYVLLAALEHVSMAALCGSAKKRVEAHPV